MISTSNKNSTKPTPKADISSDIAKLIEHRTFLKEKKNKTKIEKQELTKLYRKIKRKIKRKKHTHRLKIIEEELTFNSSVKRGQQRLNDVRKWIPSLKSKDGRTTSNRKELVETATEFYEDLYRRRDDSNNTSTTMRPVDVNIEVPIFMESEISNAISSLKSLKSPGEDGVTNDVLKTLIEPLSPIITKLFNNILAHENIPAEWETSVITLLYKKGNPEDIGNYRPISLLQTTYKVFTQVLLKRIMPTLEFNQPKEQAGFRPRFSTVDHIFTVTQIIEKYEEYGKRLYIAFVDYSKAFDSIGHVALWKALDQQGVPQKYTNILKEIYKRGKAKVKLERQGRPFEVQRGVRQGDPISPNLFTALLETIFRNLEWDSVGININGVTLNHLRFADDIVLICDNHTHLEYMLQSLDKESRKCGLTMNLEKTRIMTNGEIKPVKILSKEIEYVEDYVYLGQRITFKAQTAGEVERRIKLAWKRYWSLKHIFKSNLPIKLKKKAFETVVSPTLLYGCQTWALTQEIISKLRVFQRAVERSMLGLKLRDRIRNSEIRKKTKLIDVADLACRLKWRWAGHAARADDGRWSEHVLHWWPRGEARRRGHPRRRWSDDVARVAGPTWTRIAKDRKLWKCMEEAFAQNWVPQN